MAGKKNTPVVKKSRTGDAAKNSEIKKTASPAANEFVSEKNVRFAVLVLVLVVVGYFGYPFAKTLVVSYFSEEEAAIPGTEAPAETTKIPTEIPAEEQIVSEPKIEEEIPLEVDTLAAEETPQPAVEQEEGSPIPTMAEPALEISPAEDDPQGVDENRFSNLEAEINALKEELADREVAQDAGTAHFASAVAGLAPPLYQSRTFVGELEQIRILILGMPALDQATLSEPMGVLSDFSRTGVPDQPALETAFKSALLQALREEGLTEASGWWARTWARIKGLVVVRRTDIADGSTLEGAILKMETALGSGDIRTALNVLDTLGSGDAAAFESWAKLARGRVQALKAFEKLINFIPQQQSEAN
ncbi:MAG: hypothetical protein V3R20_03895 [Sphingomonadales bacterium]